MTSHARLDRGFHAAGNGPERRRARPWSWPVACALIVFALLGSCIWPSAARARKEAGPPEILRASAAAGGLPANDGSNSPALSGDGCVAVFDSEASNLVTEDCNGFRDVFVYDCRVGTTRRVSVGFLGDEPDHVSFSPVVSENGRFVAFASAAGNLVIGDTNRVVDIFAHDLETGITERVSVDSTGQQVYRASFLPSLSADGRYVAFQSEADQLVPEDRNGVADVFVHDRWTGVTERVSVGRLGADADGASDRPVISGDGHVVVFESFATDLVANDTNGTVDVFVHDRRHGRTERVSVSSDGAEANGASRDVMSISHDGRYVAFQSFASNLVGDDRNSTLDVFVRDRKKYSTERVSVDSFGNEANDASWRPHISADGRHVVFQSFASNLVDDDRNGVTDVFLHDCKTGTTGRVSVCADGGEADAMSFSPSISAKGDAVTFVSTADLVFDGTGEVRGVFVCRMDGKHEGLHGGKKNKRR